METKVGETNVPYIDGDKILNDIGKKAEEIRSIKENSLGVNGEEFDLTEKMKKVKEVQSEPDYRFMRKHGAIKLYFVKLQLRRYIKKQEKYSKLLQKYEILHKSLSLAVTAGFDSTKKHREYLKELSKKVEAKNGNN